jgi:S-adenosylmethionine synthetase
MAIVRKGVRTAEYVLPGHPDKLCDRIADALVDAAQARDPDSLVGVEVAVHRETVFVDGRIACSSTLAGAEDIDVAGIVRRVYSESGYGAPNQAGIWAPDPRRLKILTDLCLGELSDEEREIRRLSDDQDVLTGYAGGDARTNWLPLEHYLAWRLARALDEARRSAPGLLGPDGKVLVVLDDTGEPRLRSVSFSVHHADGADPVALVRAAREVVYGVAKDLGAGFPSLCPDPGALDLKVNGAGAFSVGGPLGDNGLSGKKLVVDAYGPSVPIGGGALSGKDPHKVDRIGALRARQIAKAVVRLGLAKEALVRLAFVPGADRARLLAIETEGGPLSQEVLRGWEEAYDLSIAGSFEALGLGRVRWEPLASWGHFTDGRSPWEGVANPQVIARREATDEPQRAEYIRV